MGSFEEFHVRAYNAGIMHIAQRKSAELWSLIRTGTINAKRESFDRFFKRSMTKRQSRFADTPITEQQKQRRWVTSAMFDDADFVDDFDLVQILTDPTSSLSTAMGYAMGRTTDEAIIDALDADVEEGENADGTIPLPASQIIDDGNPLSTSKVRAAKLVLDNADCPKEGRIALVSPDDLDDMLSETLVTSSDFNSVKALVQGELNTWLGFRWVTHTGLNLSATGRRKTSFFQKEAMLGVMGKSPRTIISRRADKNNNMQVHTTLDVGAVRMNEECLVMVHNT